MTKEQYLIQVHSIKNPDNILEVVFTGIFFEARRAAEEIIKDIIEDFQVYIYNLELFEAGEDGLVAEMDSQNDWLISFDYVRSLYIK